MKIYQSKNNLNLEMIKQNKYSSIFYILDEHLNRQPISFFRGEINKFKKAIIRNHNYKEIHSK